jgi:dTDP-4-dehydrorhamnose reductase
MLQAKKDRPFRPEVWGGIECTINRIADRYSDQLATTGHYSRKSDIECIAALGIKTLRYPVLWEHHQPDPSKPIDWNWAERQLYALRDHDIDPIVGLLHHGSGPSFTSLDDPHFPDLFAAYAGLVAERFPWVMHYTPVNEPLTTARFSGLYGIWYPRKKDPLCFLNMLLNQLKGVVLAMKAIRRVNPAARLIQTEDLAQIHSTPALAYQADFENERRWLTYDLLCGKVVRTHALWDYLMFTGITEDQLNFFIENPCIPDMLGVNYYVTSERWLDEDVDKYPAYTHGGNGRTDYADVEAVRIVDRLSLGDLLKELYCRYELPVAITEVHLNCTREEQMRWLMYIWTTACEAGREGVDIRAVTSWALLGAYDWDTLLTKNDLHYESGAYLLRDGQLHLTAVGHLVKTLARGGRFDHPLFAEPGWWARPKESGSAPDEEPFPQHRLLIFGRDERQTLLLSGLCRTRGIPCKILSPVEKGIFADNPPTALYLYKPWGVIEWVQTKAPHRTRPKPTDLEGLCRQRNIPYMALPFDQPVCEGTIHQRLDLFIDKAVGTVLLQSYPFEVAGHFGEMLMQ